MLTPERFEELRQAVATRFLDRNGLPLLIGDPIYVMSDKRAPQQATVHSKNSEQKTHRWIYVEITTPSLQYPLSGFTYTVSSSLMAPWTVVQLTPAMALIREEEMAHFRDQERLQQLPADAG